MTKRPISHPTDNEEDDSDDDDDDDEEKPSSWPLSCDKCGDTVRSVDLNASYEGSGATASTYLALQCYDCTIVLCSDCYPKYFDEEDLIGSVDDRDILCISCILRKQKALKNIKS
jgi:hypothetical protein